MSIDLVGHRLELDPSGSLWWPAEETLVVADLHLEKGSAFARRGTLLPPYDTDATLDRLAALLEWRRPSTVISLGDGFHDRAGAESLSPRRHDRLAGIVEAHRWIWINGNHDPIVPLSLGGATFAELSLQGLTFRHAPNGTTPGEIAGHLHPKARLATGSFRRARPCFVGDGVRLILPAFGAFTGGLNALDPAIASLFASGFTAWLLGRERVFGVPDRALSAEADPLHYRLGQS